MERVICPIKRSESCPRDCPFRESNQTRQHQLLATMKGAGRLLSEDMRQRQLNGLLSRTAEFIQTLIKHTKIAIGFASQAGMTPPPSLYCLRQEHSTESNEKFSG